MAKTTKTKKAKLGSPKARAEVKYLLFTNPAVCAPCRKAERELKEHPAILAKLQVVDIGDDSDSVRELVACCGVQSIPAFVRVVDGKRTAHLLGWGSQGLKWLKAFLAGGKGTTDC